MYIIVHQNKPNNQLYTALVLFEQANSIDWIMFCYILSLTKIYSFFCYVIPFVCYLLIFGNLIVNLVHFLLTEKYQKGQSRDNYIILFFNSKYKRQWINMIFL
jgi:hypothetical protein